MELGMIGLGRMGGNMVRRLMRSGIKCVVHDRSPETVKAFGAEGATPGVSLPEFVSALARPRNIWIMVPAGVVDHAIDDLVPLLNEGDAIIDGGNSLFQDDIALTATGSTYQ